MIAPVPVNPSTAINCLPVLLSAREKLTVIDIELSTRLSNAFEDVAPSSTLIILPVKIVSASSIPAIPNFVLDMISSLSAFVSSNSRPFLNV